MSNFFSSTPNIYNRQKKKWSEYRRCYTGFLNIMKTLNSFQ